MKVKIFSSVISTDDLENQIAKWTKDLNPNIISVATTVTPMHDLYTAEGNPSHGKVCNYWVEYISSIIYELTK